MARSDPNRLLVREGFRHFRRTYSVSEARWGLVVLAALAAMLAWVVWRGANPREDLTGAVPIAGALAEAPTASDDRGPVPLLDLDGWREGGVSRFDADTLYIKINGRADFFLTKGFERLYFASLTATDDETRTIDLELYDMGAPPNALNAFSAERPADVEVESEGSAQHYRSRNAVFLVQGKYYGRAIGSDESEPVLDALSAVRAALIAGLPGAEKPWAYAAFVDGLALPTDAVSFVKERAFSIESARDVWVAAEGDLELFVAAAADAEAARTVASELAAGFESYGTRVDSPGPAGVAIVEDEFLGTLTSVTTVDTMVVGVRGAADRETLDAALDRLRGAITALPAEILARARRASVPAAGEADEAALDPAQTEPETPATDTASPSIEEAYVGEEAY